MANYSTTTSLNNKPVVPNQVKVYSSRVSLTSPLLRSDPELLNVFSQRQKMPVGMRMIEGKELVLAVPTKAVKALQIALYLGFLYIDFKRARNSTPLPPLLPKYKKLNNKDFSGLLDKETLSAIRQYQTWYSEERSLSVDSRVGKFTLSSLDYDLEQIQYYRWKFDPKIFHICSSYFLK